MLFGGTEGVIFYNMDPYTIPIPTPDLKPVGGFLYAVPELLPIKGDAEKRLLRLSVYAYSNDPINNIDLCIFFDARRLHITKQTVIWKDVLLKSNISFSDVTEQNEYAFYNQGYVFYKGEKAKGSLLEFFKSKTGWIPIFGMEFTVDKDFRLDFGSPFVAGHLYKLNEIMNNNVMGVIIGNETSFYQGRGNVVQPPPSTPTLSFTVPPPLPSVAPPTPTFTVPLPLPSVAPPPLFDTSSLPPAGALSNSTNSTSNYHDSGIVYGACGCVTLFVIIICGYIMRRYYNKRRSITPLQAVLGDLEIITTTASSTSTTTLPTLLTGIELPQSQGSRSGQPPTIRNGGGDEEEGGEILLPAEFYKRVIYQYTTYVHFIANHYNAVELVTQLQTRQIEFTDSESNVLYNIFLFAAYYFLIATFHLSKKRT